MNLSSSPLNTQKPNPAWASLPLFDRTGWKRVLFGDVVENCAETCDPAEAGLERFIAMEHLEPGSLHIRSWGNVANGTTFTRRCRPGQVLFGKRRAYQRKVAVAEFEAVVSGDIYVLTPKDEILSPMLLPFLCLSERFFQHAVGTSAGSLSPRTNWSSLANFEFDLPPLDQQRRIAEILWALDEVDQKYESASKACDWALTAAREAIARCGAATQRIEDLAILVTKGESPGWQGFDYQDEGPLFITSENVLFGSYSPEPRKHIPEAFHRKLRRSAMQAGDVLFNLVGASIGRGCVIPELGCEANTNQAVAVIRLDTDKVLPEYVLGYMLSPSGLKSILGTTVNTARANLSLEGMRGTRVPVESIAVQRERTQKISDAASLAKLVFEHRKQISGVAASILNQLLPR
jgi:type I restriction enzyme S subunit